MEPKINIKINNLSRDHVNDEDDDNDGILDVHDEDDDGDGILDTMDDDYYHEDL